jgi:hypothetical protein
VVMKFDRHPCEKVFFMSWWNSIIILLRKSSVSRREFLPSLKKFTKGIILNYLAFIYFSFERTWWRLFQNRVVRTKLTSNFYWKMTSKKWKLKEYSN